MLRAPSQPETSNSPVCLRGKEKERKGKRGRDYTSRSRGMESTQPVRTTAAAKVPVQVVSPRVYDNRTLEASPRETRAFDQVSAYVAAATEFIIREGGEGATTVCTRVCVGVIINRVTSTAPGRYVFVKNTWLF